MKRRLFLLTLFVSLCWTSAYAQIVFDTSADLGSGGASPYTTANFTSCSGATHCLAFLAVGTDTGSAAPSATYSGSSMSLVSTTDGGGTGADRISLFCSIVPTSTTATFVVTFAGTQAEVAALSWSAVNQSCSPDALTTHSASSSTSNATTITTIADNAWVVYVTSDSVDSSGQTATNVTIRRANFGTGTSGDIVSDSNAVIHPAGSFTGTITGTSQNWNGIMASWKPFSAGSSAGAHLPLLGVGP